MGYLGVTLTQVFTRAVGTDVSLRDVTIAQMGNGVTECGWRHAPEESAEDLGDFEKVSELSWVLPQKKTVDFRLLAEALRWVRTCWGAGRWKSQNRKIVYLSPYVEEPLNSKVIKSFVPKLRSRKCFLCFEIPKFHVYVIYIYIYICYICLRTLWTFCVPVWICPFHVAISVSGYGTLRTWGRCEEFLPFLMSHKVECKQSLPGYTYIYIYIYIYERIRDTFVFPSKSDQIYI